MVFQGTVQNGVVVLRNGSNLPEGATVRVELVPPAAIEESLAPQDEALLTMDDLSIDTGVPDLATNINHYLYGHPKVTDGR
jgi:hypothetical protein